MTPDDHSQPHPTEQVGAYACPIDPAERELCEGCQ
jgi:hypothetical protein